MVPLDKARVAARKGTLRSGTRNKWLAIARELLCALRHALPRRPVRRLGRDEGRGSQCRVRPVVPRKVRGEKGLNVPSAVGAAATVAAGQMDDLCASARPARTAMAADVALFPSEWRGHGCKPVRLDNVERCFPAFIATAPIED